MEIKFKKLTESAVVPRYAHEFDAGADLTATSVEYYGRYVEYGTGLAVSIPKGYVGLIFPRSSVTNKDLLLKNSVGVIDAEYRGEIKFRFHRTTGIRSDIYGIGDRVGQLVIVPVERAAFVEVEDLDATARGTGGYGSTGR